MPTYTYECKKCSHAFDVFHGMNAKPRVRCKDCKGPCRKLLGTGSGIIFKGTGFYETDYKDKKGTPPSDESKKPAKSDSNGSGDSTGGTKDSSKSKPQKSTSKASAKSGD